MPTGYLMRDSEHKDENKDETEGKKKNGNGNGSNGNGNGNGGSQWGLLMAEEFQNRKTMKLQWHKLEANSKNQQETSKS